MILVKHNDPNDPDYATSDKAKFAAIAVSPYVELTTPQDWLDNLWMLNAAVYNYKFWRNELISKFSVPAVWDALTTANKQALVRHYIWLSTETTVNLDLLYTQAERDKFQKLCMDELDRSCECMIRKSVVVDSTKYFDMQLNDSGVLTTVEITTDQTL